MKPYFAKYLPVEGEIKKEDTPCLAQNFFTGRIETLTTDEWGCNAWDQASKVKLFLCSRDIKFGDECVIPYPRGNVKVKLTGQNVDAVASVVRKNRGYKVVGEISPEATWVKEGDEFDEEEVEFVFNCVSDSGRKIQRKTKSSSIFSHKKPGDTFQVADILSKIIKIKK